jgi:uncharacterized protein YjbJ (UPF0337 family)
VARDDRKDKDQGAINKVKGRVKESVGHSSSNKDPKSEGRTDRVKAR